MAADGKKAATVHPHIRGAYKITIRASATGNGSSPHTWGILESACGNQAGKRFIPTYVGHTAVNWLLFAISRFIPTYVGHTAKRR